MKRVPEEHSITAVPATRRTFLGLLGKGLAAFAMFPAAASIIRTLAPGNAAGSATAQVAKTTVTQRTNAAGGVLLKNGSVVDGTGAKPYPGSLLIKDGKISKIFREGEEARFAGSAIDCTGKVIAPGFIDAHSHMDRYLPYTQGESLKSRFTAQGITTFIGGNCGYGPGGYRRNSAHMERIGTRSKEYYSITWSSMAEYFASLGRTGMSHNLASFVGHGTTRTSIRGFDASPLRPDEMKEMLELLDEGMDQGALGVSLGLQYEPGIFAPREELTEIARLVKKKNKVLAVHLRAYSALSPGFPMSVAKILIDKFTPFQGYTPHNILAIDEMLDIARETGVRLQLSHLIFVGKQTFKNYGEALERIDEAIRQGVDVKLDTYPYHCGQSHINVVLPPWFLAKVPGAYDDKKMLSKLESELGSIQTFLGFGYDDIQITYANNEELNRYNGMFLGEIAKARGMDWFPSTMDIARRSGGLAEVLNHRYTNLEIVEALMRHQASLFMTDSLPTLKGVQNPASTGAFPLFLQYARDKKLISLEEAVYKMSGASVERFGLKDRGLLREGLAADVTVFDWNTVKDNNTIVKTSEIPSGIDAVFINGRMVMERGEVDGTVQAGVVCA